MSTIITAEQLEAAAQAISFLEPHPGLEHVDWPDGFDGWTIAHVVFTSAGFTVDAPIEIPPGGFS